MDDKVSRRFLLESSAAFGALAVLGTAVGCNKPPARLACTDTSGLAPGDVAVRTSLGYVDASVEPGKACSKCQQFVPSASANACGTCKVVKGPINPSGYCKSFVAKPA
jgi:hypothetical protein